MKPAPFDYVAPASVPAALTALAVPGAVVLAGGQSLLLELAYRAHRPAVLVDLDHVAGLDGLSEDATGVRLGALVRHRAVESTGGSTSPVRGLLAAVAPWVAHPPIRARGTFCGSLAWAHPAAEWNAVALALDAVLTLSSVRGERTVPAADWYQGDRRTARAADELLTEVLLPALPAGAVTGFAEHRRTHASFADLAVVAVVMPEETAGAHEEVEVRWVRLAVAGWADRPVRLTAAEKAAAGVPVGRVADTARRAVARTLAPTSAPTRDGSADRRRVVAELAGRALEQALGQPAGRDAAVAA